MSVRIDMSEVDEAAMSLQEFRRTYYRAIKGGISGAARLYIVPQIKNRLVPSRYKSNVTASTVTYRRDGFKVKFSVRGGRKVKDIVGFLNFGGYAPRPIFPKRRQAVLTPYGPRAAVYKPGKFVAPRDFFEKGINAGKPNFNNQVERMVLKRLEEAFK